MQKRDRALSFVGGRTRVALLLGLGLALTSALLVHGCGDDPNTCTQTVDVPNGAACVATFAKLECFGKSKCGGVFSDVADAAACTQLATASTCETSTFDDADNTCQVDGCSCTGFSADELTCTLTGCHICGNVCGYQLTDVPDVEACVAQAVDFNCTTSITYDEVTRVCGLVGCLDCRN